jgi:hypothetical protein
MPLKLLIQADIEAVITSVENGEVLLQQAPVRRHLFYLGGVPRWIVLYVSELLSVLNQGGTLTVEVIDEAFAKIKALYLKKWDVLGNPEDSITLLAYAVSGVKVRSNAHPISGIRCSALGDKSFCLIKNDDGVIVPYALLHQVATYDLKDLNNETRIFVKCAKELIEYVDKRVYDMEPWKLWETFGAYFHTLRINALLITGRKTAKASEIFSDALVNCSFNEELFLRPTLVLNSSDALEGCKASEIGLMGHPSEKHDWLNEDIVVINAPAEKGVDVFFALKTTFNRTIVFLDQRKRVAGADLGIGRIRKLLEDARLKLDFLPKDSIIVACLFSCLLSANVKSEELPLNSTVVTKESGNVSWLIVYPPRSSTVC